MWGVIHCNPFRPGVMRSVGQNHRIEKEILHNKVRHLPFRPGNIFLCRSITPCRNGSYDQCTLACACLCGLVSLFDSALALSGKEILAQKFFVCNRQTATHKQKSPRTKTRFRVWYSELLKRRLSYILPSGFRTKGKTCINL